MGFSRDDEKEPEPGVPGCKFRCCPNSRVYVAIEHTNIIW